MRRKPAKGPVRPSWLSPFGVRVWHRVVTELEPLGVLSPVDRDTLAGFCDAASFAKDARDLLVADGLTQVGQRGELVKNPTFQIWQQAIGKIESLGSKLGLNPSARLRLLADLPDDYDDDDDLD